MSVGSRAGREARGRREQQAGVSTRGGCVRAAGVPRERPGPAPPPSGDGSPHHHPHPPGRVHGPSDGSGLNVLLQRRASCSATCSSVVKEPGLPVSASPPGCPPGGQPRLEQEGM